MRLDEITAAENENTRKVEKCFRHDLSVILASACLLIILLFSGTGFYYLLYALRNIFPKLIADWNNISLEQAKGLYSAFYNSEILENSVSLISYLLSIFIPVLFAKKFLINKPKKLYPLKAEFPAKAGSFIFFSIGLCYVVNILCALLFQDLYPETGGSGTGGIITVIVSFIMVVIIAPFGEELVFRGVFFQSLSHYGQPFAIFLSALIFGLAHRNPPSVINAFVMGICLAVGFAKTRSITVCVLIHLANNAFAFMVPYLVLGMNVEALAIVIAFAMLTVAGFTVAMIINYTVNKKSGILYYDDMKCDFPRLNGGLLRYRLLTNFFFLFYILLVAAGAALLYI
ncbi:MAG: type II CAAX endopeptidase family protein [Eubacteriales bacterium]|nr:type II CAAX endopeptidase family protein [Eubacteriales bacterium]